jgi:polyisoprenoid-binding protein YceI
MALQGELNWKGLTTAEAYFNIDGIELSKSQVRVAVNVYSNSTKEHLIDRWHFSKDWHEQDTSLYDAYIWLKTQPEFAGCTDC